MIKHLIGKDLMHVWFETDLGKTWVSDRAIYLLIFISFVFI